MTVFNVKDRLNPSTNSKPKTDDISYTQRFHPTPENACDPFVAQVKREEARSIIKSIDSSPQKRHTPNKEVLMEDILGGLQNNTIDRKDKPAPTPPQAKLGLKDIESTEIHIPSF